MCDVIMCAFRIVNHIIVDDCPVVTWFLYYYLNSSFISIDRIVTWIQSSLNHSSENIGKDDLPYNI